MGSTAIRSATNLFPTPYYKIEGGKARAEYGNYVDELVALKRNGVLKARGDLQ